MTKSELIEQLSEKLKLPNGKAELIINCIFDEMVDALQNRDGIEIRGFGSFTVRDYKSYEGRNPRTGETVHVAPKRLPFFKVGKDLRERVNSMASDAIWRGDDDDDNDDNDDNDDDNDSSHASTPTRESETSSMPSEMSGNGAPSSYMDMDMDMDMGDSSTGERSQGSSPGART